MHESRFFPVVSRTLYSVLSTSYVLANALANWILDYFDLDDNGVLTGGEWLNLISAALLLVGLC